MAQKSWEEQEKEMLGIMRTGWINNFMEFLNWEEVLTGSKRKKKEDPHPPEAGRPVKEVSCSHKCTQIN